MRFCVLTSFPLLFRDHGQRDLTQTGLQKAQIPTYILYPRHSYQEIGPPTMGKLPFLWHDEVPSPLHKRGPLALFKATRSKDHKDWLKHLA
ncbi:hypothetical protein B0T13DRAFT_537997 [Neurospora crassa]|nr:hypothetical protein B0T13DRAFT_537997 [Neurospora crassa]